MTTPSRVFVTMALASLLLGLSEQSRSDEASREQETHSEPVVILNFADLARSVIVIRHGESRIILRRDVERIVCRKGLLVARTLGARRFRIECI